ncbi:MAG: hypothetical protein K6F71_07700 [Ruminococcus sp.]|uniref:ORC-CDC6 family AAA ATPase n=1 Tax=Ruminococcus sp. TaxID=41978 RepID=UPI002600BC4B|nr:hypothetical protein [Ruminococcus sp.]MCR5540685.1 hypothetical protein [Ruminococcus sp.]
MKRLSDLVKGTDQQNPFSDSQARNFSDSKVINEFCPISNYWSLFNDQHEILLGTRGSGKTFLLRMMRYSMLKHINDPRAKEIAQKKEFIALYVPMHLEFVSHFTNANMTEEMQILLFQISFNFLLAESLLVELKEILSEEQDRLIWAQKTLTLSAAINSVWFDEDDNISDFFSLSAKIKKIFYNFNIDSNNLKDISPVFKHQIGTPLIAVKELISKEIGLTEEPTWIICIDEAEFLSEPLQRCINSIFRSDSKRVALKVATLPFYHRTLKTLDPKITVSAENDFCYRVVDLKYNDQDFINLTNSLCVSRLKTRFDANLTISSLEEFVGMCGNDDQIDYYRNEVGEEEASYESIIEGIISELSDTRKKHSSRYKNQRKTIYDKFAPIFYVRRMYLLSKQGNRKPGWYAGSQMIRKISQGNPRAFIQIMNKLFEKARKSELTPKVQHSVILDYAKTFCFSTLALENTGPTIYKELEIISKTLNSNVHDSYLKSAGSNFILKFDSNESFDFAQKWIVQAIAYSRITVNSDTLIHGISKTSEYLLSNAYAAYYWIPMRADVSPKKISIENNQVTTYLISMDKENEKNQIRQLSFFEENDDDNR